MKLKLSIFTTAALLCASQMMVAQAPAGSTGQCKDGSYTSVASKSGACRGHQGIQTWFATAGTAAPAAAKATTAAKATPAAPAKATPAATPAPASAPAPAAKPAPAPMAATAAKPMTAAKPTAASGTPAPGGGPGMVWVNTSSKVYHCPGTKYYGLTKDGKYMSEKDAVAAGAHADHGNACSK